MYVTAYTTGNCCLAKRGWQTAPTGDFSLQEQHFTPPAAAVSAKAHLLATSCLLVVVPHSLDDTFCLPAATLEHSNLPHLGERILLRLPQLVLMLFCSQIMCKEKKHASSAKTKGSTFDC